MTLENRALHLAGIPHRVRQFLLQNAKNIAERTFGEIFLSLARGRGLSKRYQQSFHITQSGFELDLELDYIGENNEPLGIWFEKGTKRHFIEPSKKKTLSWIDSGERFYSKGHFVSGIPAKRVVEDTIRLGMPLFKRELQTQIQNHLEATKLR